MSKDEWIKHVVAMSEGNPGAAAFFADMIAHERYDVIEELYMNDITGVKAYLLWKDVCGYYINKLFALMKYAKPSEIQEMIKHAEDGHHMTAKNLANVIIIERAVEKDVLVQAKEAVEKRKAEQIKVARDAYGYPSLDVDNEVDAW